MCLFKKNFFVWLPWVFVAVCGLLSSCGMQASRCRAQALGARVQCWGCCSVSPVQLFAVLWTAAHQVSLSFTISWSLLKLLSTESVMPSNHLILCLPFLLLPSIFPSIRVFSNESLFASGGQSIGTSASASIFQINIQGWFPLELTGLISLQYKGLSRVFSNTVQKHQFYYAQLSLWSNSHIHTWLLEKPKLWLDGLLLAKQSICFLICCLGWS